MEEIGFVTNTPDAKIETFQDRLAASCEWIGEKWPLYLECTKITS